MFPFPYSVIIFVDYGINLPESEFKIGEKAGSAKTKHFTLSSDSLFCKKM